MIRLKRLSRIAKSIVLAKDSNGKSGSTVGSCKISKVDKEIQLKVPN